MKLQFFHSGSTSFNLDVPFQRPVQRQVDPGRWQQPRLSPRGRGLRVPGAFRKGGPGGRLGVSPMVSP